MELWIIDPINFGSMNLVAKTASVYTLLKSGTTTKGNDNMYSHLANKQKKRADKLSAPRSMFGFSLIELMVVVVIIGIIAAFAYPAYLDTMKKSRRADAQAGLGDAASRMEQFYLDRKSYSTNTITDLGLSDDGGNTTLSQESYYKIDILSPAAGDACIGTNSCNTYTLRAVPQAKGNQDQDTACSPMTLDSNGTKTPNGCW